MKISFVLAGEGSSDLRLVEHIENVLIAEGFSEVTGEAPDLGMLPDPVGCAVGDKIPALVRHYPSVDIIFVHRDSDGLGAEVRHHEIMEAAENSNVSEKVIPIVPVTMLETWLLADVEAIKSVAGNRGYARKLGCIPSIHNLEGVRDSKKLLLDALCEASQTTGGRLAKFKKRFSDMRARLTFDLDPDGPVNDLESYKCFREKVSQFSREKMV